MTEVLQSNPTESKQPLSTLPRGTSSFTEKKDANTNQLYLPPPAPSGAMSLRHMSLMLCGMVHDGGTTVRDWAPGPWMPRLEVVLQLVIPLIRARTVLEGARISGALLVNHLCM